MCPTLSLPVYTRPVCARPVCARPVNLLKVNVDKHVFITTQHDLFSLSSLFTDNCQSWTEAGAVGSNVGTIQSTTSTTDHSTCMKVLYTGRHIILYLHLLYNYMSYSVCIYAIYYTVIFVCESTNNRYSCACEIMCTIVVQIILKGYYANVWGKRLGSACLTYVRIHWYVYVRI